MQKNSGSIYRVEFRDRLGVNYNEYRKAVDKTSLTETLTQEGCYIENIEKIR
ncbi:MAG: hypothetical protein ACTSP4_13055 [Candidatus Hodarchaeales archaeon]